MNSVASMSSDALTVAQGRIGQVFRYLQGMDQLRNPAKRQVREQLWTLWLRDLPQHPCVSRAEIGSLQVEAPDTSASENAATESTNDYVVKIARPKLIDVPRPPAEIASWLRPGWADLNGSVEVIEERSAKGEEGEDIVENFSDSPSRIQSLEQWQPQRDEWAVQEKLNRETYRVYERFYELHSQIAREPERLELVLGDGILNWRRPEGGVHHPLLLQRLQLDFDAEQQEFTLREADFPVEFYSAMFRGMIDVNGQVIGRFRQEVETSAYHPLDGEATDAFLESLVAQLSPHGAFVPASELTGEKEYPRLGRDPVVFLRTRTLGFATALEGILSSLSERTDLPPSLLGVVGIEHFGQAQSDSSLIPSPTSNSVSFADGNEDASVLLSKPANPEQLAIAQRLEQHGSVLVQGPPGTGKTHTIANLIGHLLAQGKTVLITSHTTKALRVLREKVVPTLQPLCVSVLDSDMEGRHQLESSVNTIVERLSTSDSYSLRQQAESIDSQRRQLIERLHQVRQDLFEARAGEYREIVLDGRGWIPAAAAREVAEGQNQHDWIPGPVAPNAPLPLTEVEFADLYRSCSVISSADENELQANLPDVNKLPAPEVFARTLQTMEQLRTTDLRSGEQFWQSPAQSSTSNADGFTDLQTRLNQAVEPLQNAILWKVEAIAAGHSGGAEREAWESLLRLIDGIRNEALQSTELLLNHGPTLAPDQSTEEQEKVLTEIVTHMSNGGGLGAFTLLTKRIWKKLIEGCKVDQGAPSRLEHFQALQALARLDISRCNLKARWDRQMAPLGAPASTELGDKPEVSAAQFAANIRQCLEWQNQTWEPLRKEIESTGLQWSSVLASLPPNLTNHGNLLKIRDAVIEHLPGIFQAQSNRTQWQKAQANLAALERYAASFCSPGAQGHTSVLSQSLFSAIQARDTNIYSQAQINIKTVSEKRPQWEQRQELLKKLEGVAPNWAEAIRLRQAPHQGPSASGDITAAWRWQQLSSELEKRSQVSIDRLQKESEAITQELRSATAELIDRRAWGAQVERTSLAQRKALVGWAQTVKKIGKGTGKRVPKLQAEARRLMNECRSAVPVWIMPLARVVENFDARVARFDVVIIDEASQSDVMGLIAFYLGKQIVVVGDDEQVSPDAVGQKVDEVQHLIDEHLSGIPIANLYDGQYSVYDVAKSSFGGTICLREHFRCVPDIIRFSNYLSYDGAIKALRDASSVQLKPHVVSYRVEGATRDNKVNEEEALAITSLLIAASEQPEYEGLTFGVVSLVGLPQAERIDWLLRSHMEATEYEKRHIVCGNAAHFQGDERDLMFISVVDTPKEGPLSFQERGPYKKRLNVAASRARDQMWVVHSLQPEIDLKPGDLRRRFLEFAQDPQGLERQHESEEAHVESEFERQVLRRLLDAGYRVVPQWKVGGYRIDLVVEGEGKRLAVECDGDRYHGLDKLPDDMARQAILERLGWKFARIRGSDFFRDPDRSMLPVFQKLQDLGIEPMGRVEQELDYVSESGRSELQERVIRRAAELRWEWSGESAEDETTVDDGSELIADSNSLSIFQTAIADSSYAPRSNGDTPSLFDNDLDVVFDLPVDEVSLMPVSSVNGSHVGFQAVENPKRIGSHNVYVVELSEEVLQQRKFLEVNPQRDPSKPPIYVGMTGHSPEERFANHKSGYKANRYVQQHGIGLLPHLYTHLNPMSYEEAKQMEERLADQLREEGYAVWQH